MEELFAKWTEEYPELETTASNAEGEYEIAEIGSVEDTVEFFVEAATYE